MATVCRRCIVSGRVQGVFYRATTRRRALELGLEGWARNLPDGTVEVVASGGQRAVEELCEWLHEGPGAARVTAVHCESYQVAEVPPGFDII